MSVREAGFYWVQLSDKPILGKRYLMWDYTAGEWTIAGWDGNFWQMLGWSDGPTLDSEFQAIDERRIERVSDERMTE